MIKQGKRQVDLGEVMDVFIDEQTGKEYSRIVGGLAWPYAGKPGYAAVLAEDFKPDKNLEARHIWVLRELEALDVADLIRRCRDMREAYKANWVGNIQNKPLMAMLYQLQKGFDYKDRLSFDAAPHADDPQGLGYYLPIIKEHLGVNRKLLHFGEGSKLPGYLAEMGPETLGKDPAGFPPIASLGYALSYLYTYDPEPCRIENPRMFSGKNSWMSA
jgi:hypothetical protein